MQSKGLRLALVAAVIAIGALVALAWGGGGEVDVGEAASTAGVQVAGDHQTSVDDIGVPMPASTDIGGPVMDNRLDPNVLMRLCALMEVYWPGAGWLCLWVLLD